MSVYKSCAIRIMEKNRTSEGKRGKTMCNLTKMVSLLVGQVKHVVRKNLF